MKALLQWIRLLLLAIVILGIGTLVVWRSYPEFVDRVEGRLIREYSKGLSQSVTEARNLSREQPEKALPLLEELCADLEEYRRRDRHFSMRRGVVSLYADVAIELGEIEKAVEMLNGYTEEDPRDLPMLLRSIELSVGSGIPDLVSKGRARLEDLFEWLPTVSLVARAHVLELQNQGREMEIADALRAHLSVVNQPKDAIQNLEGQWKCYWGPDRKFSGQRSAVSKVELPGEGLSVSFEIPGGASFVRFDAPRWCLVDLGDPKLRFESEGQIVEIPLQDAVWFMGMKMDERGMSLQGGKAARVVLAVPESFKSADFRVTLKSDHIELPTWITELLSRAPGRDLEMAYLKNQDWGRFQLVRGAWVRGHLGREVIVSGAEATHRSSLAVSGQNLAFDLDVQFAEPLDSFSISFPLEVGDHIVLKVGEVVTDSGREAITSASGRDLVDWSGVDWIDGVGTVTATPAKCVWRKSSESGPAKTLVLEGVAR